MYSNDMRAGNFISDHLYGGQEDGREDRAWERIRAAQVHEARHRRHRALPALDPRLRPLHGELQGFACDGMLRSAPLLFIHS